MTTPVLHHGRSLRATTKVLPEHARSHNRSLVLQTLYRNGQQSRADLARNTGLTKVTISDLIAELLTAGIVVETGQRESSGPGKPAVDLDIARSRWQIIGIDLSDAELFLGALLDLDGRILERVERAREGKTGTEAIDKVRELVETLQSQASAPLLGVGVGSPGVVDLSGTIRSAPNLGWTAVPLQEVLSEASGLPVLVANDANVAVLAEHSFGGSEEDLILVNIGHGVGAGLVVNDSPIYGRSFAAGEIGHVLVGTDDGPPCACGRNGCLEAWLAAPRLRTALAESGPERADETLREAGRRLGIVLAPVITALGLTEIVLSGPIELIDGALLDATRETLRSRLLVEFFDDVNLRVTEQGSDIVLRGAAMLVLSGQLGMS